MGRQLAFWKYEDGADLNAREVYEKSVIEGSAVTGLAMLPEAEILSKVKKTFREYERLDDYNYGGLQGNFTIHINSQSVMFDCSMRMNEEELNKIIDLMAGFGCPYYDPQIDVRFEG
ncbi:MAG: hypothetical protein IJ819_00520 [Clostridiales bacterium]|nr:hypothetical protein [Clostridiales bacterium]